MPKQTFTLNDFSGGVNGYVEPLEIDDKELALCQGFKVEPGVISVLGDMKGSHVIGIHSGTGADVTDANENISIEAGYGLFSYSTDFDIGGGINNSEYTVLQNGIEFNQYYNPSDDSLASASVDQWLDARITLGTAASDASFAGSVKPCFFVADGILRVSSGNFTQKDNGGQINGAVDPNAVCGVYVDITTDATISNHVTAGDTIVIGNQEMVVLRLIDSTSMIVARNMTGVFSANLNDNSTIYSVLDNRWYGYLARDDFKGITNAGRQSGYVSTYAHPRPPVMHMDQIDHDNVTDFTMWPFLVKFYKEDETAANDGNMAGVLNIGFFEDTDNADATWDGAVIKLYVTALYDDVKQESQPHQYVNTSGVVQTLTIPTGKELALWIGAEFMDPGSTYNAFNPRASGARLYYEDTTNDAGVLYQLLEIDFQHGCKKADSEAFTDWVTSVANKTASCPTDAAKAYASRTGSNAFIFANPPKAFTYELNTGYPPDVNIHARYKTAVISNRRLYAGNIYQSGKVNGDRMISSPVNKFDILPEYGSHIIDVTQGDGDEIVKLEAYADRLLQYKKRTLYIINIGGGLGEEFLESQHRNMGVENPSQTCMTEYGVAWVNSNGVFLYDGQEITDLTLNKLKMTHTTANERSRALNVTESNIPLIGYHPDNKWLIVHPQSTVSGDNEVEAWIHDFKNGAWMYSQEFTAASDYKTNMVWTGDNNLVFAAGTNSSNTPDFFKYRDAGTATPAQSKLILRTKDFHLDAPSVKKKLKSVYITYSANGSTEIQAHILFKKSSATAIVDSEMEEVGGGTTYYTEADGFKTTSNAVYTVELKPSTVVTDALSFQFQLFNEDANALSTGNFKLYNVSFVYRPLGVR